MYHYYITIGTYVIENPDKVGQVYLDNFLEVDTNRLAEFGANTIFNQLCEEDEEKIENNYGKQISNALEMIQLRSHTQKTQLLKFTSEFRWNRDMFESYVKVTPIRDLLKAKTSI